MAGSAAGMVLYGICVLSNINYTSLLLPLCSFVTLLDDMSVAYQEMPQKLKDFQQIDRNWTKMMRRSCDQKNVLEVP